MAHAIRIHANGGPEVLKWEAVEVGEPQPVAEAEFGRMLGWHPIVIENFRLASSRPKLINFDRYSQITLHALKLAGPHEEGRTVEIDAVIGKSYLVTYHRFPVQSIEQTLEDYASGRIKSAGPDEVLYHIVSHLIEKYVPAVEEKKDLIAKSREHAQKEAALNKYQQMIRNIVNVNMLSKRQLKQRDFLIAKKDFDITEKMLRKC